MKHLTIAYFNEEVCRFRQLFGERSFWQKTPEQRQLAVDGLGYVYLNLAHEDGSALTAEETERVAITFDSTMQEYSRREWLVLFNPPQVSEVSA